MDTDDPQRALEAGQLVEPEGQRLSGKGQWPWYASHSERGGNAQQLALDQQPATARQPLRSARAVLAEDCSVAWPHHGRDCSGRPGPTPFMLKDGAGMRSDAKVLG